MKREYAAIIITALLMALAATVALRIQAAQEPEELEAETPEIDTRGVIAVKISSEAVLRQDEVSTPAEAEKTAQSAAASATEGITEAETEGTTEVVQATANTMWTDADAIALAQMAWGEARGCSKTEQAATMWCVLNRVDAWGGTVLSQTSAAGQFYGYSAFNPVTDELYALAVDVLTRWERERAGAESVGRVLPSGYIYFTGDGVHNYFRNSYTSSDYWDYSWGSPYGEV